MPRAFSKSTAELVVQVVAAIQAAKSANSTLVQSFCDLSKSQADDALALACDLGLAKDDGGGNFSIASHLARFLNTPEENRKAALLRIVLESFDPFLVFRERLVSTGSVDIAARQTVSLLDLSAHREDVKDTLLSLGTYTGAIISLGGGQYEMGTSDVPDPILGVAEAANDLATAESYIRRQIGQHSDGLDRQDVILPLAEALLRAKGLDARGAVVDASRAIESFLFCLATSWTISLAGATGITQKLDKFRPGNHLPKKILEAAKYLAQVRNAADHGVDIDPDVGKVWKIREETGTIFVLAACAFMRSCLEKKTDGEFCL